MAHSLSGALKAVAVFSCTAIVFLVPGFAERLFRARLLRSLVIRFLWRLMLGAVALLIGRLATRVVGKLPMLTEPQRMGIVLSGVGSHVLIVVMWILPGMSYIGEPSSAARGGARAALGVPTAPARTSAPRAVARQPQPERIESRPWRIAFQVA